MNGRTSLVRLGIGLSIAGIVAASIQSDRGGNIPLARADDVAAAAASSPSPAPLVSVTSAPQLSSDPSATTAASTPADAAPAGGDLAHLTFTAIGDLHASLVSPADGTSASSTTTSIEVETVAGAGVQVQVGDQTVPFTRIGKRSIDVKTGATRYTYYGIPLVPGPNVVVLTAVGAEGASGTPATFKIYAPGPPTKIALAMHGAMRADGKSVDQVSVTATDAWNRPAAGAQVDLTLAKGDAKLEKGAAVAPNASPSSLPSATPAPQNTGGSIVQVVHLALDGNGSASVNLVPGLVPGAIELRANGGDTSSEAEAYLSPDLRKPFVNGLVSVGAGEVPGIPGSDPSVEDGANSRRGRIAIYGSGAVGTSLATFAYDTANRLDRASTQGTETGNDPNDRPYDITGDTSTLRDDALSRDHLAARIDNGRTSLQWGEFKADTGGSDGTGGFDQLVDGAKVEYRGTQQTVRLFAARNDIGYDRRVFAPSGLAGGVVLDPQIVVNSESVMLATIDQHTGAVIAQTPLVRGVDYSIEYTTGQLTFLNVPLPFDQAFNPNQVVVTYEYDAPGSAAKTVGGRFESNVGHGARIGVGYVNDTTGAGNVTLSNQNFDTTLVGGHLSLAHVESTGSLLMPSAAGTTPVAGGGGALFGRYDRAVGANTLSLAYNRTGAGYDDPFGGLTTPGLLDEHFSFDHHYAGGRGDLALDFGHQSNAGIGIAGTTQTTAELRAREAVSKRLTLSASLDRRSANDVSAVDAFATPAPTATASATAAPVSSALVAETSTQASVSADWRAARALDVSVDRIATIAGSNQEQPAQTDAQISYDLGQGGRAYLRERWSAAPEQSFAAATQSLTDAVGGTHTMEVGVDHTLGAATTADTSYVVDHTLNGNQVYALAGIKEKLHFGPVTGDAFVQRAAGGGADSPGGFALYGLELGYGAFGNRFHTTASTQIRTGEGGGTSVNISALGALNADLSAFATIADASAGGTQEADERAGLAWRPANSDAGVTLLQYERTTDTDSSLDTASGVLSLEQVLHVRLRTDVVGRYAYKLDGDSTYEAGSSLLGLRVEQRLGSRFDAGVEVRHTTIAGIAGTASNAFAVEGGVRIGDEARFALGYNADGSADPSLSQTPTHRGFYVTFTSLIDRIAGWGRGQ